MAKKKHRKKVRAGKRAVSHKATKHAPHGKHAKRSKRGAPRRKSANAEAHSVAFLRAIKRRREAERGMHHEPHGTTPRMHGVRKSGVGRLAKHVHHHGEPVVTEKSFENMLAFRRFQDHAR